MATVKQQGAQSAIVNVLDGYRGCIEMQSPRMTKHIEFATKAYRSLVFDEVTRLIVNEILAFSLRGMTVAQAADFADFEKIEFTVDDPKSITRVVSWVDCDGDYWELRTSNHSGSIGSPLIVSAGVNDEPIVYIHMRVIS